MIEKLSEMADSGPPVLSIVTVCFNDADGVSQTLESVLSQKKFRMAVEVIVVDGSCDYRTSAKFASFASRWTAGRCVIVSEADEGVYDAMNKGTAIATGRYVQYLNSGDALHGPSALATIEHHLALNSQWVVSGAVHGLGTGQPQVAIKNVPHSRIRHAYGLQSHCHQACWFRLDTIRTLGGYDSRYGFVADFDLIVRFGLIEPPVVIRDELIFYAGGGLSSSRGSEIPMLIAKVRRDRLYNGSRSATAVDTLFVNLQVARRASERTLRKLSKRVLRGGR